MLKKAFSLKQSLKTIKTELDQRDNIAESLKRQNRELRHTLSVLTKPGAKAGQDFTMYAPKGDKGSASPEGPFSEVNVQSSIFKRQSSKQSMNSSTRFASHRPNQPQNTTNNSSLQFESRRNMINRVASKTPERPRVENNSRSVTPLASNQRSSKKRNQNVS